MARFWALPRPILQPGFPRAFNAGQSTLRQCSQRRALWTLGIETSCDDTCVALLHTADKAPHEFLSLPAIYRVTCANKHHRGVHPVEAVESHTRNLAALLQTHMEQRRKINGSLVPDLIAVTRGPGMKPCLSVGISFAKALSVAWGVPLIGVHHMQAHALSIQVDTCLLPRTKANEPQYPFLNLLVSGGHTMLVLTKSAIEHRVLVSTQRGVTNPREKGSATAVGEMLDKCARDILPPHITAASGRDQTVVYAKEMESFCWKVPGYRGKMQNAYEAPKERQDEVQIYESKTGSWFLTPPLRQTQDMIYDFTGLGGQARAIMRQKPDMEAFERRELAYHTMRLAFEHLMSRAIMALQHDPELLANPPQSFVISGGVASNKFLSTIAASMLQARGFGNMTVTAPRPAFCTDNAAMIAWAGQKMYNAGWETDLSFLPQDEWPIEEILTGVDCWVRRDAVARPESRSNVTASQQDKTKLPEEPGPQESPLTRTVGVEKRAADGEWRDQIAAGIGEQVSGTMGKARVSSPGVGRTANPRPGPHVKPPSKPTVGFRKVVEGRGTDMGGRAPREEMANMKNKNKNKQDEHQQYEKRFVRLLPPPPADKPVPTGSIGIGLDKLRKWAGL